ncbi:MAG: AAA family ATPase [Muribaculaceae bacterium]|nr:AAA family ATPase [Muribaculaceae bacterium]
MILTNPDELRTVAMQNLPFEPTEKQSALVDSLSRFIVLHSDTDVYIVNGYAGSGKTSIIGALIKGMKQLKMNCVMLAPTGRAAKVAGKFAGITASTIHKRIYRATSADPAQRRFVLAHNGERDTIFFVDEASMITHRGEKGHSLLEDLVEYVYSGDNCALVLTGDTAQLPPPGESTSPAMSPAVLRCLGLNPFGVTLHTTMRQQENSGILYNATLVRTEMTRVATLIGNAVKAGTNPTDALKPEDMKLKLHFGNFDDFRNIQMIDFADELSSSWANVGKEETLIITRSNRRANMCNRDVRNRVLYADEALLRGEMLVISKNDYYWGKVNKSRNFIANGETAIVEWIGSVETKYGHSFADAELRFPADNTTIGCKILLDSLESEGPAMSRSDMLTLYEKVLADYQEGELSTRMRKAAENPYFNAMQVKYAYCVTCHKSQGGQWTDVYIDMSGIAVSPESYIEFLRWLYTAITRATRRVFLLASPLPSDLPSEDW